MKCPKCQFENPANAKFCNECGHPLSPASGTPAQVLSFDEKLAKIQRYLPTGLTEKILSQKDRIEGERRQVSVMFCDMEGFSTMVGRLGSERSYHIMDQVYEILIHKVHEFGGTVNEMTGDGIMALFGAPIALEDAPQRALWSAQSIHNEIHQFNKQNRGTKPIKMRIGIHTGPVVVGSLGNDLRVEFKAVGDTVNLASRMEKLAEAETTFVTEATYKLTKDLFRFQAKGKKIVKGKEKAIPVYKVLSGKEEVYRPRLGSERMIYAKMVGRDHDLDKLQLQVMKAINGKGSIVNITGEAGIGKSRLIAELKKHEVMNRVAFLEGRAISIGKNLSFLPIIDIFKQWARIRENDGEAMALGKLEAAVSRLFPEKFGEVLPFVATLMGMKLSGRYAERVKGIEGEALENLILKNVRELIIRASDQTPLVIVIEDLHWADTSSIELLESLLRLAETQRILFVNVFRPGYSQTGDRIAEAVKKRLLVYYVEIVLEPLDAGLSEALINNMLKTSGIQPTIIRQIVQRAGGNPFFIEEVVRSFIDEHVVVVKNGSFKVTEKIHYVTIPHTINDVLMARIDRLEEETRDLVKVAAVIGRNFFLRVLADVVGTVKDIDSRLSYLKEIQIVRKRKRMGELEYLFKHTLAQEAAYDSILPPKRRQLHLKIAESIEKIFNEKLHEFYGMLAYHYSQAENLEKAEEFLIKAGEEALKSSASEEALNYYQEALKLYLEKYGDTADAGKVMMLEKNIALALYNKGQYEEAVDYFDKVLSDYWGELPKHPIKAAVKFFTGILHLLACVYFPILKFRKIPSKRDNEAADLFFKKLKALAIINPKRFFLESFHFYKRVTSFELSKFELGLGLFVGSSTLFSFSGISFKFSKEILDLVKVRITKKDFKPYTVYDLSETVHNYLKGDWENIKEYDEDLVNKNLDIGEIYWASQHFHWHGWPKIYQGSFDTSKLFVNKLNEIFEIYENDFSLLLKQLLNSGLLVECRKLQDALAEIDSGIEFGEKIGQGQLLIHMFSCKARIHILLGNMEEAKRCLEHADKIRQQVNTVPWQLSNFCRSHFEYDLYKLKESLENGNQSAISEYRRKAIKSGRMLLRQSRKVAQHRTESYRLKGIYFWLNNSQKKALKWWNKSIKEGERLGARLDLSRTYHEVGKRLLEAKSKYKTLNGIGAEEYLIRARDLFEEMDLQWDLNELNRVTWG
jgi:class 3 adenylate cyclase/tetratricopeptide (TPR) repeat protein